MVAFRRPRSTQHIVSDARKMARVNSCAPCVARGSHTSSTLAVIAAFSASLHLPLFPRLAFVALVLPFWLWTSSDHHHVPPPPPTSLIKFWPESLRFVHCLYLLLVSFLFFCLVDLYCNFSWCLHVKGSKGTDRRQCVNPSFSCSCHYHLQCFFFFF